MYEKIRKAVIVLFIVCVLIVTIVVIFAIWNVFAKDIIGKSFESLAILILSAAVIMITTFIREGHLLSNPHEVNAINTNTQPKTMSVGRVILYVLLFIICLPILLTFLSAISRGY